MDYADSVTTFSNIGDVVTFALAPMATDLEISADTLGDIAREIAVFNPALRVYTLPAEAAVWDAIWARINA